MAETEKGKESCQKFWKELGRQFHNISGFIVGDNKPLADYYNDNSSNDGCNNPGIKAEEWEKYTEKLNNLDKMEQVDQVIKEKEELQTQLSDSQQNTVMASTLGPASGIGAGLSLFPLMAKFLKR